MAYDVPSPELLDIINEFWPVEVIFGQHMGDPDTPMWGYYAIFNEDRMDPDMIAWENFGHGETLLEAFEQARAIQLGLDFEPYPWEHFLTESYRGKTDDDDGLMHQ